METETRDRCYLTNCLALGPALDRRWGGWMWRHDGRHLGGIWSMSDDVTWSRDHVRVTVWHQMTSDDGIMISVTRFSYLSPPPHAKSENDSRGVAGAQLKTSDFQQLDWDKIPRLDLPNFRWTLMSLSLRKVNIPGSELHNIGDWLHKSGMMTRTEKTKEVNDMFLIRISGAAWAHSSLSLSIPQ